MGFIYKITNRITGKSYIGKTAISVEARYKDHLYLATTDSDKYLYRSMRKHGFENFTVEEVIECCDDQLDVMEKNYITEFGTLVPHGYNLTEGGDGGDTSRSHKYQEGMKKLVEAGFHKGANNSMFGTQGGFYGKKHTDESIRKQSAIRKAHWDSMNTEHRVQRGKKISGKNNGMFGRTPPNSTRILFDGVEYKSIAEAARATNSSVNFVKKHGVIL